MNHQTKVAESHGVRSVTLVALALGVTGLAVQQLAVDTQMWRPNFGVVLFVGGVVAVRTFGRRTSVRAAVVALVASLVLLAVIARPWSV